MSEDIKKFIKKGIFNKRKKFLQSKMTDVSNQTSIFIGLAVDAVIANSTKYV
jgi:hypothetical protein